MDLWANCVPATIMVTSYGLIQLEVADLDFVSCWLQEEDSVEVSEVRNVACACSNLPGRGSRAWARS